MSYRCEVCNQQVPERLPRLTHVVTRRAPSNDFRSPGRTEIDREIPVCKSCSDALELRVPLADLLKKYSKRLQLPALALPSRFTVVPPPGYKPVSVGVPVKIV